MTGFSTLCLAATSSQAERIPLDYPKHLTHKWGVRRRNVFKKQLLNGTVSQFDIERRHTNLQPSLRHKVNSCARPWSSDSMFSIYAQSFTVQARGVDVRQSLADGPPSGKSPPSGSTGANGGSRRQQGPWERKREQPETEDVSSKVRIGWSLRSLSLATPPQIPGLEWKDNMKERGKFPPNKKCTVLTCPRLVYFCTF